MSSELDRLKEKNRHLEIINRFAIELSSFKTESDILWYVAREVVAGLGFVDVVIYLLDEDHVLKQHAAFGDKNPREYEILDPIEIKPGAGVVGRVAQSGEGILVDDTRDFPDYIEDDAVRLSELAVPIKDGDRVLGVIDSEHPQPGFYTLDHLETLNTVAYIVATKLKQLRTVTQLEKSIELLEYGKHLQDTLFQIAEISDASENLGSFFIDLHALINELTYARNFSVALETEDGNGIQYHYAVDEMNSIDTTRVYPVRSDRPTLASYIMDCRKPGLLSGESIRALEREGRFILRGTLPTSLIGVPFGTEPGNRGVVVLKSYDENILYEEKDKNLIQFVSNHICNAIERTRTRQNLAYLALHDSLTGLPNRSLFMDRLKHALHVRSRDRSGILAVLFLDLDRFKTVNDRYGHLIGDKFLCEIARRIAGCLREADTLCRLGGDEFAILIEYVESREQVASVARRVLDSVAEPTWVGGARIDTTTSIGITCDVHGGATAETLLREADEAMYQAKARGRNGIRMFEPAESGFSSTHRLERRLSEAIQANELFLVYQPVLQLKSRRITGAESLVRWRHPEHGIITPAQFIPDAEHTGLITDVDVAVVRIALDWLSETKSVLPDGFRLGVNLSGKSLTSPNTMSAIRSMVAETPGTAGNLCFEVTERALVENLNNARHAIDLLKDMDIRVALDDFGTGYSSLSYLNKLPLDVLKIDRSFTGSLDASDSNRTIIEAIISMADALNLETIAEGIENKEQVDKLIGMGCALGQGFHLGSPGTGRALRELINVENRRRRLEPGEPGYKRPRLKLV